MSSNTFKCNHLMPLHFKGLMNCAVLAVVFTLVQCLWSVCFMPMMMAMLSPSCYGLQKLLSICENFANTWDIKFNPAKSQVIKFGSKNSQGVRLCLSGSSIGWVDKVKYIGTYLVCNSGLSDYIRKFYSQPNNVLAVLGKYSQEMSTLHLVKTYCLPTLLYGGLSLIHI